MTKAKAIAKRLSALPSAGRCLVAVAGPPGSGKSTLADQIVAELGAIARLVPMDGFHLDNCLLDARGLRDSKGAPESFDLGGLKRLVTALHGGEEVIYPIFDRNRDLAIAGAGVVETHIKVVVIERNYLMFDEHGWRDLADMWDACLFLDVPEDTLRHRLVQRWLDHGMTSEAAQTWAESNDLTNARRVMARRLCPETEICL